MSDELTPEDNPFACSICGTYLSSRQRIEHPGYCDLCMTDSGGQPE